MCGIYTSSTPAHQIVPTQLLILYTSSRPAKTTRQKTGRSRISRKFKIKFEMTPIPVCFVPQKQPAETQNGCHAFCTPQSSSPHISHNLSHSATTTKTYTEPFAMAMSKFTIKVGALLLVVGIESEVGVFSMIYFVSCLSRYDIVAELLYYCI